MLKLLVFLLPLFFLPITSEFREFNKQALMFFAVVVMLIAWVIKILTTRKVSWTKTSLDYLLLAYLIVYLFSSFLSLDSVSSFLGYYGRFTGSFMSVIAFIVLYFLIVNNITTPKAVAKVKNWFFWGIAVTIIYSFLQICGLYLVGSGFAQDRAFNTIGSMVALAFFSAVALLYVQWKWFTENKPSKVKSLLYVILTIMALGIMLVVNAFTAWIVLALGMMAFLALSTVVVNNENTSSTWFWKPMLVLVISVLFVAFQYLPSSFNPRNLISVDLPVEIQLSNSTTLDMVKNTLSEGVKQAVLGSGPGTTGIAFGNIKPQDLNKTIVWSLNFDRASSEVANITIETGLLGLLVFEITSILFLLYAVFFLLRKTSHAGRTEAFGFFMVWLTLYITHFFYFFNTTFYFMYWVSLALFMAVVHWRTDSAEEKTLSFSSSPRSAISWMFVSLLLLAALLVGAFFEAAVYGAEVSYASGLKELNKEKPNFQIVANNFAKAVNLNQYRDVYWLAAAQNFIFLASEEAAKPEPNMADVQTWLANAVNAGSQAKSISPEKASNWSALAQFYENLRPLKPENLEKTILETWQGAIDRDPKNPSLYIRKAQAYLFASDVIDPSIAGSGQDSDSDGLADSKEQELGSNPQSSDSNGNGVADGEEVKLGFNPSGTGRLTSQQLASFTKVDQAALKSAQEALNKAMELKDDLPDTYLILAGVLEKQNKLSEAKKQLDEAAKKFPGNASIAFEQGRMAYNQKNYSEAEGIFLRIIRDIPNHANARYSLGLIYLNKGDKVKALEQFEKTREIIGPNVDLEKLINQLKDEVPSTTAP